MQDSALLDELMAEAWPPEVVRHEALWRLRWTSGVTRRANSALAVGGEDRLEQLVRAVEDFYESRQAPAMLQVSTASAPAGLGPVLRDRGYVPSTRTLVQHAPIGRVLASTGPGDWSVESAPEATDSWFRLYWGGDPSDPEDANEALVCRSVLLRPAAPAVYVTVRESGEVRGVGQAVVDRGWAGVQCIATDAGHRRRGIATSVLHHLARAAQDLGSERMYLAVTAESGAARALYDRAGFASSHEYRYLTRAPLC